jgi:hypothetical protein
MKIINHKAIVDNDEEYNEAMSMLPVARWAYTKEQIEKLPKDKIVMIEWNILDLESLDSARYLNKEVIALAIKLYHKLCKTSCGIGNLLGIQATDEDLYWILQSPDGKVFYDTCVDGIEEYEGKI